MPEATRRTLRQIRSGLSVTALLCSGAGSVGAEYTVREITVVAGGVASVAGINSTGTAAINLFGPDRAATWSGSINGFLEPVGSDHVSAATAINTAGIVVGYSTNGPESSAIRWNAPGGTGIELPSFGIRAGLARDINSAGDIVGEQVVGQSFGDALQRAVLWPASGGVINLGTLSGSGAAGDFSFATAINDRGDIAGVSTGDTGTRAFFRPAGAASAMIDIGTLGAVFAEAADLNDFGEVVGNSRVTGGSVDLPYRWNRSTGLMVSLGTLRGVGAFAASTNNRGQVVGYDRINGAGTSDRAFLVNPGGSIRDLNALIPSGSGWVLQRATGINNAGTIVGVGWLNGQPRAFVLIPEPGAPVPACFADVNRDGSVNTSDLTSLLGEFGDSVAPGGGTDVNGDGTINTADLVVVLSGFGLHFA